MPRQKKPSKPDLSVGKSLIWGGLAICIGLSAVYYAWLSKAAETTENSPSDLHFSSSNNGFFSYSIDKRPATLYEKIEATPNSLSFYAREDFRGLGVQPDSLFRTMGDPMEFLGSKALRPNECDDQLQFGHQDNDHHEKWHSSQRDIIENGHRHFHLVYNNPDRRIPSGTMKCIMENIAQFEEAHGFCTDGYTDCLIGRQRSSEISKGYEAYLKAYKP